MSKAKGSRAPPPPNPKGPFDAKAWATSGVSEEEVINIKAAFDLFDTDLGGSVDIKGKTPSIQN